MRFYHQWRQVLGLGRSAPLVIVALVVASAGAAVLLAVVDVLAIRDLPFRAPSELVDITQPAPNGIGVTPLSPRAYLDLRDAGGVFQGVAAFRQTRSLQLDHKGVTEEVTTRLASPNAFELLGVRPVVGRLFGDHHGNSDVVLSFEAWSRWFDRSASAVGAVLDFDDGSRTVVGVLPNDVSLPLITGQRAQVYLPYVPEGREAQNVNARSVFVYARLQAGATVADAQKVVERVTPAGITALDDRARSNWSRWFTVVASAMSLAYLASVVSLSVVLMLAQVRNVSEHGVRRALGATHGRLASELCLLSISTVVLAGVAGLVVATWVVGGLQSYLAYEFPRAAEIVIDLRVALLALGLFVVGGSLAVVPPLALSVQLPDRPGNAVSLGLSRSSIRLMRCGVGLQAGLVAVLLVGTFVLGMSYLRFVGANLGFDEQRVFSLPYGTLRSGQAEQPEAAIAVRTELLHRLRRNQYLNGVAISLGATPLSGGSVRYSVQVPGRSSVSDGMMVETTMVSEGYFETLRISLLEGRLFTEADRRGEERVAILSEAAVREWFGSDSPVGSVIDLNGAARIIGVVASVFPSGPAVPAVPTVYTLIDQDPFAAASSFGTIVGRLRNGDRSVLATIVAATREVAGSAASAPPVFLEDRFSDLARERRFHALVTMGLGLLGLIVACAAVHGTTKFYVAATSRELAIRLALGARSRTVLVATVIRTTGAVAVGVMGGLAVAYWLARSIQATVFGVATGDRWFYFVVGLLITGIGALSAIGPTLAAVRADPLKSLRG